MIPCPLIPSITVLMRNALLQYSGTGLLPQHSKVTWNLF